MNVHVGYCDPSLEEAVQGVPTDFLLLDSPHRCEKATANDHSRYQSRCDMSKINAAGTVLLFLAGSGLALADEVKLRNGATLEGTVQEDGKTVTVDLGYGTVSIDRSEIISISKPDQLNEEFERRLREVKEDDPNGRVQVAQWAAQHGLKSRSITLLRKVLTMDPNNAGARHELGYVRYKDAWLNEEEYKAALGLVRYQGEWMPADAAERLRRIQEEGNMAQLRQSAEQERQEQQAALERQRIDLKQRYLDAIQNGGNLKDLSEALGYPWTSGMRYWGPAVPAPPLPNAQ